MRVRIRFSKQGKVRFTSHRDVARMWERAVRRAALPVAYSEGFSPRPKLHFGLALSTGHESLAEYLDVDLVTGSRAVDVDGLAAQLSPMLPVGIDAQAAAEITPGTDSLQQAVTACEWSIGVPGADPSALGDAVAGLLAAEERLLTRQRKGRDVTDDVRPYVRHLCIEPDAGAGARLTAVLGTQPRGLRPAELLAALGDDLREGSVCRASQWIERDGGRREPLPIDASWAPTTLTARARAS